MSRQCRTLPTSWFTHCADGLGAGYTGLSSNLLILPRCGCPAIPGSNCRQGSAWDHTSQEAGPGPTLYRCARVILLCARFSGSNCSPRLGRARFLQCDNCREDQGITKTRCQTSKAGAVSKSTPCRSAVLHNSASLADALLFMRDDIIKRYDGDITNRTCLRRTCP